MSNDNTSSTSNLTLSALRKVFEDVDQILQPWRDYGRRVNCRLQISDLIPRGEIYSLVLPDITLSPQAGVRHASQARTVVLSDDTYQDVQTALEAVNLLLTDAEIAMLLAMHADAIAAARDRRKFGGPDYNGSGITTNGN